MMARASTNAIAIFLIQCTRSCAIIDLALSENAGAFLQHSVVGGPSYDAFVFPSTNPIYTGSGFWPWVVNGYMYEAQPGNSSFQVVLAGEYPHGYFNPVRCSRMRALYSIDGGATFSVGPIVIAGNVSLYDQGGGTPDGSVVIDGALTRIVYDWGTPANKDGGLGYAEGPGLGPYVRSPIAIVAESKMAALPLPQYRRVYGGTLFRRDASDWLILAAISTKGNGGGTWGLCSLTAPSADGPWSTPVLLLTPQSAGWHAHPTEFYPAFVDGSSSGYVYAPATSISSNRNYQLIWRAPLASAHVPSSWQVLQDGSAFHWEGRTGGPDSIWGQTFSAFVSSDGLLHAMFPSLSAASVGSLNVATVPWAGAAGGGIGQRVSGFFVSAPATSSLALSSGSLSAATAFDITASAAGSGLAYSVVWSSNGPVGADKWPFPGGMDPRTGCDLTTLALAASGFRLLSLPPGADCVSRAVSVAQGPGCALVSGVTLRVQVWQSAVGLVNVSCDGVQVVTNARVQPPGGASSLAGRLGVYASTGTAVNVTSFVISEGWETVPQPVAFLAVDGMTGAGNLAYGWSFMSNASVWRFGNGLVCDADAACEHVAKWNFVGVRVSLWAPRGVMGSGNVSVSIDGGSVTVVNLSAPELVPSAVVWTSEALVAGRHAISVRSSAGVALPVDSIEVAIAPTNLVPT